MKMKKTALNHSIQEQYGATKSRPTYTLPLWHRLLLPFMTTRNAVVRNELPKQIGTLVELGCADGAFLYATRSNWVTAVGVDVVDTLLNKARKRSYKKPVKFMNANFGVSPMPFRTGSVDVVVCIATLQYFSDLELTFHEIHRILKKDGVFIFEVPNFLVFWRRIQLLFGIFPHTSCYLNGWDAGQLHYFSLPLIQTYLPKKGFHIKKILSSGLLCSLRNIWVSLLAADIIIVSQRD
jgi:SAM-dependent methyltransferase